MLKEITDLLVTEQNLRVHQVAFTTTMKSKLKHLCTESTDEMQGSIQIELELLLSSSLKYKTGRYKFDATGINWKNALVLTRSPGLKAPHESYSSCNFSSILSIDKNKNLRYKERGYQSSSEDGRATIKLSILLKEKNVHQNKLKSFYDFLERYIKLCKILKDKLKIKNYNHYSDSDVEWEPIAETKIGILLAPMNYRFVFKNNNENSTRSSLFVDSETMHTYLERDEGHYSSGCQVRELEMLTKSWEPLWKQLLILDKQKGVVGSDLCKLIKDLKEVNKPFRLLQKLVS